MAAPAQPILVKNPNFPAFIPPGMVKISQDPIFCGLQPYH